MTTATLIPRVPVASSNIKSLGYQDGILAVEFKSGDVLHYQGVPLHIFTNMVHADSVGKEYLRILRGQYPAERVITTGETIGECPACGDKGLALTACLDCGCGTYTVAL